MTILAVLIIIAFAIGIAFIWFSDYPKSKDVAYESYEFYEKDGTLIGTGDFYGNGIYCEEFKIDTDDTQKDNEKITWTVQEGYAKPSEQFIKLAGLDKEKRYIHKNA